MATRAWPGAVTRQTGDNHAHRVAMYVDEEADAKLYARCKILTKCSDILFNNYVCFK